MAIDLLRAANDLQARDDFKVLGTSPICCFRPDECLPRGHNLREYKGAGPIQSPLMRSITALALLVAALATTGCATFIDTLPAPVQAALREAGAPPALV